MVYIDFYETKKLFIIHGKPVLHVRIPDLLYFMLLMFMKIIDLVSL